MEEQVTIESLLTNLRDTITQGGSIDALIDLLKMRFAHLPPGPTRHYSATIREIIIYWANINRGKFPEFGPEKQTSIIVHLILPSVLTHKDFSNIQLTSVRDCDKTLEKFLLLYYASIEQEGISNEIGAFGGIKHLDNDLYNEMKVEKWIDACLMRIVVHRFHYSEKTAHDISDECVDLYYAINDMKTSILKFDDFLAAFLGFLLDIVKNEIASDHEKLD
jgi:hypothetical protein